MATFPVARARCGCAPEATESGRMMTPADPRSMSLALKTDWLNGVNQSTSVPVGLSLTVVSPKLLTPS